MTSYREWLSRTAPTWLRDPVGEAWLEEHGREADNAMAATRDSVKARGPGFAGANGDALALLVTGSERQLPRGPADTDAVYGERLRRAWSAWERAGTPLGMLLALEVLGYTNVAIVQQEGYGFTLDTDTTLPEEQRIIIGQLGGSPPRFSFDAGLDVNGDLWWNRFAVLFLDPVPASWSNVVDPPTSSTAPTLNEVNTIRRLIRLWKPGEALCMGIAAVVSGLVWDWPPGLWSEDELELWDDPTDTVVIWSP